MVLKPFSFHLIENSRLVACFLYFETSTMH